MNFEFATAAKIAFGPGNVRLAGPAAAELGQKALVVVGLLSGEQAQERAAPLLEKLSGSGVQAVLYPVLSEPTIDTASQGAELAAREGCELVIGFGGGSAMDTGKAVAALLTNPGDIYDYLEVVGKGRPLSHPAAPCIAIPTTAGTGSEVTRNAVLGVPNRSVKVSLRSPSMLPRLALVDPELTYGLPPEITASTGLDALTQLIEPLVSNKANPMTDALCREGIRRAARSLLQAYRSGDDPAARQDMSLASLFGGLALANSKLGAVHGFAGPLGGMFPAPHGVVCARLLPFVMEFNLRALRDRQPDSGALRRYDEIAQLLTGSNDATAQDGINWVKEACEQMNIPPLGHYGVAREDFPELIEKSAVASSMQGNPIRLTSEEMEEILNRAL